MPILASFVIPVSEMRQRGDGYGTISKSMGMSIGMVRRIIELDATSA